MANLTVADDFDDDDKGVTIKMGTQHTVESDFADPFSLTWDEIKKADLSLIHISEPTRPY